MNSRKEVESAVLIENKDDGHKGELATAITCDCFSLLNQEGIPTYFLERENERRFFAQKVWMIPIVLVCRRIAAGSYLQRYPKIKEGTILPDLALEMFYRSDDPYNPLMFWNSRRECIELYNAHVPLSPRAYLFDLNQRDSSNPWGEELRSDDFKKISEVAKNAFLILEKAWKEQEVILVDLQIECGWNLDCEVVVAGVIDDSSWQIQPKRNSVWVAEATKKFVH